MYQCNNFSSHWSSVSLELTEKEILKQGNKKSRFLVFKTVCCFNLSEKLIFNILLMIDLVMTCAKISEPDIKATLVKVEDYSPIIL